MQHVAYTCIHIIYLFSVIFSFFQMNNSCENPIYPEDHILFGLYSGQSGLRILSSRIYLAKQYMSCYPSHIRMFPDHLDGCGMEEAAIFIMQRQWSLCLCNSQKVESQNINILVLLLNFDEFSDIMGFSLPKKEPRSTIRNQYLMNDGPIKIPRVIRKLMGKKSILC